VSGGNRVLLKRHGLHVVRERIIERLGEHSGHVGIVDCYTWQALIVSLKSWSHHVDFIRLDPKGEFYLWRLLEDDLVPTKVAPGTALDPILVLLRISEAIAVGISVAKALGWDSEAQLGFGFRWTRLSGRHLESWANPMVSIQNYGHSAHDAAVDTFVEVPAGTPVSAIAPYVEQATRDLFLIFGGYTIPSAAIEHWAQRLVERKLS
jgi:hypothetical protein